MFTDPDEYGSAINHASYDLTITQRGAFTAKLVQIILHRLWMQHNEETSSRVAKVQVSKGRVIIGFLTEAGPDVIRRGTAVNTTDVVVKLAPGDTLDHVLTGRGSYGTMSLPVEDVEALGVVMLGRDLTNPELLFIKPAPEIVNRVQRLHAAARHLAEYAPAVLTHPEATRSLEQEMIEGLISCLGGSDIEEDRAALRRHAAITRRFRELVDAFTDQPLYLPEVCRKIGVSERTLRACCHDHFGMAPKHYLGRVDGFCPNKGASEGDESGKVLRGFLAAQRDPLEALE